MLQISVREYCREGVEVRLRRSHRCLRKESEEHLFLYSQQQHIIGIVHLFRLSLSVQVLSQLVTRSWFTEDSANHYFSDSMPPTSTSLPFLAVAGYGLNHRFPIERPFETNWVNAAPDRNPSNSSNSLDDSHR